MNFCNVHSAVLLCVLFSCCDENVTLIGCLSLANTKHLYFL